MKDSGKTIFDATEPASNGDRRQQRALDTRRELIDAARRIFARDGFEVARIEDIASIAGKTRGAFYANFQDKDDVFFALIEEDMARDSAAIRERLQAALSQGQRLEELSQYLLGLFKDKKRMLLSLEFKLYAIRRPHRQRRLADLHAAMCLRCAETKIDHLLPELHHADPKKKRRQAAIFGAVLDGLTLNRLFDPTALREEQMLALIRAAVQLATEHARKPTVARKGKESAPPQAKRRRSPALLGSTI